MKATPMLALMVLVAVTAVAGASSAGDTPPPAPPWVGADGTVDISKMPAQIEVAGPDGKPIVCADGRRLTVPRGLLFGPPAKTPAELLEKPSDPREYVWRCGPGPNGSRNPVRVPAGG